MRARNMKVPGYCLCIAGILVIFTSAALSAIYDGQFDMKSQLSHSMYILDILSTVGVLLIPAGLAMIMQREPFRSGEKTYLN